jgi:hemolysin activation/secretion protein
MNVDKTIVILTRTVALLLAMTYPAYSQGATYTDESRAGGITKPGDIPLELPATKKPPIAPIKIETKEITSDKKSAAYGVKIFVKEIKISGNTAISTAELKKITAPYENRIVYNSELEDVRIALTRKYIDSGYINSGAVLPDHKVSDGIVHINIIEGRLTDIEVVGNKHLDTDYIKERIKLGASIPLNVNDLQEQIQIMIQSPSISTINSALRPGDSPGEANLTAMVKEGARFEFNPVIDNQLSPTLGAFRLLLPVKINNITGQGDALSLSHGSSEGLSSVNMNWDYSTVTDTTMSIFANYSDSKIVNGSFKALNIVNKAQTVGFRVSHPFSRTSKKKFSMSLGMDVRKNNSELLGAGFAFSSGVPTDGKVQETVIRFSQDWTQRGLNEVLAVRSLFSFGIDALGATVNSNGLPSGEFTTWLGQFQWASLLGEDLGQVILRTNAQLTEDSLFGMEQYSLGGALSVRGYRENQIVRDTGYNVSLEYRYALYKDANGKSILTLAPFYDAGGSKNNNQANGTNPNFISSVGLGLRWNPIKNIHAQIYWGHAFQKIVNNGESLQDDGLHFQLNANLTDWF